jgi:hypothetical protein
MNEPPSLFFFSLLLLSSSSSSSSSSFLLIAHAWCVCVARSLMNSRSHLCINPHLFQERLADTPYHQLLSEIEDIKTQQTQLVC